MGPQTGLELGRPKRCLEVYWFRATKMFLLLFFVKDTWNRFKICSEFFCKHNPICMIPPHLLFYLKRTWDLHIYSCKKRVMSPNLYPFGCNPESASKMQEFTPTDLNLPRLSHHLKCFWAKISSDDVMARCQKDWSSLCKDQAGMSEPKIFPCSTILSVPPVLETMASSEVCGDGGVCWHSPGLSSR